MGRQRKLRVSGLVYPRPSSGERTLRDHVEEFGFDELDKLCEDLVGLDVLVEHRQGDVVGKVVAARRNHADCVEAELEITALTPCGEQAIVDIEEKRLVGLSLSHEYKAGMGINFGPHDDFRSLLDKKMDPADRRVNIHKRLIEVSVTNDPARPTYISGAVAASAAARRAGVDNRSIIGEATRGWQQVGIFSASMEASAPANATANAPATTSPATEAPATAVPAQTPASVPSTNTDMREPETDHVIDNEKKTDGDKADDGKATDGNTADGKATDTAPTAEKAATENSAMDVVDASLVEEQQAEMLQKLQLKFAEQERRLSAAQAELKAGTDSLAEKRAEMQAEQDALKKRQEEADLRQKTETEKRRKAAIASKDAALAKLASLLEMPTAKDSANPVEKEKLAEQVAKRAISAIESGNKQQKEDLHERDMTDNTMANFGMVSAGAANHNAPQSKRTKIHQSATLSEFYSQNPSATVDECKQFVTRQRSQPAYGGGLQGMIRASFDTMEPAAVAQNTGSHFQFHKGWNGAERLSMASLYPNEFEEMCGLNDTMGIYSDTAHNDAYRKVSDTAARQDLTIW